MALVWMISKTSTHVSYLPYTPNYPIYYNMVVGRSAYMADKKHELMSLISFKPEPSMKTDAITEITAINQIYQYVNDHLPNDLRFLHTLFRVVARTGCDDIFVMILLYFIVLKYESIY
jgi:hypothetical protein